MSRDRKKHIEYMRAWHLAHPEYGKKYYLKNKEYQRTYYKSPEVKARRRERYRENLERSRKITRIAATNFRKNSREKRNAIMRRYYHAHLERSRAYGRYAAEKRRARKVGAVGVCSMRQWMARVEYHGWKCRYCGCTLTMAMLVQDHAIPLARGGSNWPSNMVPSCKPCNSRKNTKTLFEYLEVDVACEAT